jgi:hypothetical protein
MSWDSLGLGRPKVRHGSRSVSYAFDLGPGPTRAEVAAQARLRLALREIGAALVFAAGAAWSRRLQRDERLAEDERARMGLAEFNRWR